MNAQSSVEAVDAAATPSSPWARLHARLMPDYNRKASLYWWSAVVLGAGILVHALANWLGLPLPDQLQVVVGVVIAVLAGLFPVRIPNSKSSFAAGEIFIFLLLLLQGPAAAALAAAAEGFVGAMRTSRRWTSRIGTPTMAAIAMFGAGSALHLLLDALQRRGLTNDGLLVVAAMLFSLLYFTLNGVLLTAVGRFKRNERFQASDLLGMFGWVGIAFAGSAAVAALLYLAFRQSGLGVLMAVVPILGMLLATLHYYNRHLESQAAAEEALAQARAREAEVQAEAARREAEAAQRHLRELEASERRFHSAFTHASIGMALLSFEGRILQANGALQGLLGVLGADLQRQGFRDFVAEADRQALDAELRRVTELDFDAFALELRCRHVDGRELWVALHCSFFSEPGSTAPCLILQVQDISARRAAEAGLHHLAFHDSLTGLPNRRRFGELLGQAVERSRGGPHPGYAVMFLDFDRFKLINDSLGHSAGDEFLAQVARRIEAQVRPGDVVARLGGDEFAILMNRCGGERDAIALAERLMRALGGPFQVAGTELNTSASIGITTSEFGYEAPEDVLRDADLAMYKAKAAGKARYALFDASLHAEAAGRLNLEGELRRALDDDRIAVAYQPLFDLRSGALVGFEALARWTHHELGVVTPDRFIPVAEDSGLIVALTDAVLSRACRQLREWQQSDPAFAHLTMNVNLSAKDLSGPTLVARVTRALVESRLQPESLVLELTENILMERLETALPVLEELRSLGIALSVDDFGTGYSSLSHLSSLPIDSLKVDRSFVRTLHSGSKEAMVVRAVVNLGNSLGKRVIAEGIETEAQFAQLRDMGCQTGQGFHMSRPLSPQAVDALLQRTLVDSVCFASRDAAARLAQLH